jgi:hypothetical protein
MERHQRLARTAVVSIESRNPNQVNSSQSKKGISIIYPELFKWVSANSGLNPVITMELLFTTAHA